MRVSVSLACHHAVSLHPPLSTRLYDLKCGILSKYIGSADVCVVYACVSLLSYYSMHVSRTQTAVLCCDLMSIDLSAVSYSSNVHYSRSDIQQCQGEPQKLGCFEVLLKVTSHCEGSDLISAQRTYQFYHII